MKELNEDKKDYIDISFIDPEDFIRFISDEKGEYPSQVEEDDLDESDAEEEKTTKEEFLEEFKVVPTDVSEEIKKESSVDYVIKSQEDTRGKLALIYTLATFLMFILGFAVAVLDGLSRQVSIVDNLEKVLPLLSGIFLGSLGFVLGYYFRKAEENNDK